MWRDWNKRLLPCKDSNATSVQMETAYLPNSRIISVGDQARIQDFLKGGGREETLRDVIHPTENCQTPPLGHSQAPPPPLDIARVTSSTFQGGGGGIGPGHAHFA